MNLLYEIVYPEHRWVSPETLAMWASDAIANGDTDIEATDEQLASDHDLVCRVLGDSGYATVTTRRPRLPEEISNG